MTMPDEPDSVDELISRYLDGEATDVERARIERDPELAARASEVRTAIDSVAAPVTVPELELDRIRATAIAQSTTSERVTDFATARADRLQRRSRVMTAAAAFVFLAIGVVAIQSLGGSDDDDRGVATEATNARSTDDASDAAADEASAEDGADLSTMSDGDMAEAEMADAAEAEMVPESGTDSSGASDDAVGTSQEETAGQEPPRESTGESMFSLIPEALPAVADADELVAVIREAFDGAVDAEAAIGMTSDNLLDTVCPEAADLLGALQPAGTAGVEQASVTIGTDVTTVVVGAGVDGSLVVLTHEPGDCTVITTQAVIVGP